jgi:hypothetical protein
MLNTGDQYQDIIIPTSTDMTWSWESNDKSVVATDPPTATGKFSLCIGEVGAVAGTCAGMPNGYFLLSNYNDYARREIK